MNRRILVIGIALACAIFAVAVLPAHADDCTVETPGVTTPVATVPSVSVPCPQIPTVSVPQVNVPTPAPAPAPTPQPSQPQPSQPQPQQQQQSSHPQQSSPSKSSSKPQAKSEGSRQQTTNGPKVTQTVTGKPESEPKSTGSSGGGGGGHAKPRRPERPGARPARRPHPGRRPHRRQPDHVVRHPRPGPVGVPNFFIEKFRIPPFLLPIYQAAGIQYNVPWQVLAAINEIETDYGRNLSVSSAGARGWMQFLPSSWKTYGVDANDDGRKDPYNPADAIFAAARYLKAAGADQDIRKAIFAYNHATWYVDSVMLRAKLIGGLPAGLVGSLTGLTQGHFPVHARREVRRTTTKRRRPTSSPARARPVIAVQDGVVKKIGSSTKKGRYLVLQDAYGNRYTYAHLGSVQSDYPVPKPANVSPAAWPRSSSSPKDPRRPRRPPRDASINLRSRVRATVTKQRTAAAAPAAPPTPGEARARAGPNARAAAPTVSVQKERLYAHPARRPAYNAGGKQQLFEAGKLPGFTTFKDYFTSVFGLNRKDVELKPLRRARRSSPGRSSAASARPARPPRTSSSPSARRQEGARRSTPSRSSTAGSCSSPRRSTAPRARTRSSARTAQTRPSARSCSCPRSSCSGACSTTRASTSTRAGARTSRAARSTAACWPRSSSWPTAASGRRCRR